MISHIQILTVSLSLLVLSGCRLSMRSSSDSFAVDMHAGPGASEMQSAGTLSAPTNSPIAERSRPIASQAATEPTQKTERETRIKLAGWQPTSEPAWIEHAAGEAPQVPGIDDDSTATADDGYPLNLTTALQLAGGNNLQIALADERIHEAVAKLDAAKVLWLPSLNVGAGFNSHTGQIQATQGEIVEVDRQSVFVGGGPVLGTGPLAGGAGGPMRMMANLSPVDAWFEPLAEQQLTSATEADQTAVYNDTLYQVTVAWLNLQSAQSQVAIANEAIGHARTLTDLTREFADAGAGLEADALRAEADGADRMRMKLEAEERRDVASAQLARLLRLPAETTLHAVDAQPLPLEIVDASLSLGELVSQGVTHRPEVHRQYARTEAARQRATQEKLRPWLPKLQAGLSAGGFGGGRDNDFGDLNDRVDIDALAIWELRNLGYGNAAMLAERESQHRQATLTLEAFQDQVAAEVAQAYARVVHRRVLIDVAAAQLKAAEAALPLNFKGIKGGVLRPIEAQQAITHLATARQSYLQAIIGFNEAQFALLRAVGEPPQSSSPAAE